ncbi:MAG: sensor domain-containing protein [Streptosporangiaceae bacterium]|nr:sensor domain-containing protein [Streptosporangiaceae bacterium]
MATGLTAISRGLAFSGLMLAGLGLLAVLIGSVAGLASGVGFVIVGPPWATGRTRMTVLVLMVLALFVVFPLLVTVLLGWTRGLASFTRRLAGQWCGVPIAEPYRPRPRGRGIRRRLAWQLTDPATWRDLLWLTANGTVAWMLAAAPAAMILLGLLGVTRPGGGPVVAVGPLVNGALGTFLFGIALLIAAPLVAPTLLRGYALTARAMLAPSDRGQLARRVEHLSQTRTETLDTGAAEIRRIERDLHDGAQARLVAMGMTLDAAGQLIDENPKAARALLIEARDNSAKALQELRALVRGIHPPVLADRGLADAIRALALDTPLRIHLASDLNGRGRPPAPVESAAYFAVSELIANVTKHARASQAWVDIRHAGGLLKIGVTDDGHGGADPHKGTGLHGIERRLAAFDGVLAIGSPPGGPTSVTMEIPCVLS